GLCSFYFFFSSRRRHTRFSRDWSSDVCSSDLEQAWQAGATEICMQGGIDPSLPGSAYFDLAREIKRRAPGIHLHAFSPMEVINEIGRASCRERVEITVSAE